MSLSRRIIKYVFPNEYNELEQLKENKVKLTRLNSELNDKEKIISSIDRILQNRNNIVLGLEEDSTGQKVIVYRKKLDPIIYVVNAKKPLQIYTKIVSHYREVSIDFELEYSIKTIHIEGIKFYGYDDEGYGSIAMDYLSKIAKYENVKKITGWIKNDQKEDLQMISSFYHENGYTIDRYNYVKKELNLA